MSSRLTLAILRKIFSFTRWTELFFEYVFALGGSISSSSGQQISNKSRSPTYRAVETGTPLPRVQKVVPFFSFSYIIMSFVPTHTASNRYYKDQQQIIKNKSKRQRERERGLLIQKGDQEQFTVVDPFLFFKKRSSGLYAFFLFLLSSHSGNRLCQICNY